MRAPVLGLMISLVACLSCAEPVAESPESAVLKFLIASNGMGHFERAPVYCVGERDSEEPPDDLLAALRPFAQRVVPATECRYSSSLLDVVTRDDEIPGIWLYARVASVEEEEQFAQEQIFGIDVAEATIVMAGFYKGELHSVDFICWVSQASPLEVRACDVWAIS